MVDRSIHLILGLILSCYHFSNPCYAETDTLQQGQQFKDWDYLISSNKVFILKFFGSWSNTSPYLGVFYHHNKVYLRTPYDFYLKHFPDKPVWVANRNNPDTDTHAKLVIGVNGKLSIISSGGTILDLFSPSLITHNASVKLLDSGNLVLQELYPDGSVQRILWQSFDYPTDTLLPGMKLGVNLKTGHRWSLTSWASDMLPAPGTFTLTADINGTGQLVIMRNGNIHWMSGPWLNDRFENTNRLYSGDVRLYYISNETEQSFTYLTRSYESFPALTMHQDGQLKGSVLNFDVRCGSINDPGCAEYEFENFKWRKGYYFFPGQYGYIFEDEYVYDEIYNLTLYDCKRICWHNCSCVAYTYATQNRAGCKTYNKMRYSLAEYKNSQYTEYYAIVNFEEKKKMKWTWLIIGFGSLAPLISFLFSREEASY